MYPVLASEEGAKRLTSVPMNTAVLRGWQGRIDETVVPVGQEGQRFPGLRIAVPEPESSRSIMAQWCLPLTRQHAGRRDSWFANGKAAAEANNSTIEMAMALRIEIQMFNRSLRIHPYSTFSQIEVSSLAERADIRGFRGGYVYDCGGPDSGLFQRPENCRAMGKSLRRQSS